MMPLPIGFWTGALLFDMVAIRPAKLVADVLVRSGITAAVPPAPPDRRTGRTPSRGLPDRQSACHRWRADTLSCARQGSRPLANGTEAHDGLGWR
jgi:hypothetical protein